MKKFDNLIDKKLEYTKLLDIYSDLLTKKQRESLNLYFNEDLSYNEIAEILGISKQAAFDKINKACKNLVKYEESVSYLCMQKEFESYRNKIKKLIHASNKLNKDELLKELKDLDVYRYK